MSNTLPIIPIGAGELSPDGELLRLESAVAEQALHGEDRYICDDELRLYGAIDGMGSYKGADEAAQIIRDGITESVAGNVNTFTPTDATDKMRHAFAVSERSLKEYAFAHPGQESMGAVAAAGHFFEHEGKAYFAYGVIGDAMFAITRKRTDMLLKSEEESIPGTPYVFNAMDGVLEHWAELRQFGIVEVEDGDRIFFMTDGITGDKAEDRLHDSELWHAAGLDSPQSAVDYLLAVSLDRKADDKTVLAIDAHIKTKTAEQSFDERLTAFLASPEGQRNAWLQNTLDYYVSGLNASDRDARRMTLRGISQWMDPTNGGPSLHELLRYAGIDTRSGEYYAQEEQVAVMIAGWMVGLKETAQVQAFRPDLREGQQVWGWCFPEDGQPYLSPYWMVGPTQPNGNVRLIGGGRCLDVSAVDLVRWQRGER